jgi:hypothetical protein
LGIRPKASASRFKGVMEVSEDVRGTEVSARQSVTKRTGSSLNMRRTRAEGMKEKLLRSVNP